MIYTPIRDLIQEHGRRVPPGCVREIHISPDDGSATVFASLTTPEQFIDDWGHAMGPVGCPFADGRYVGVVHQDGAVLVELP